jgi:hypothetical protein
MPGCLFLSRVRNYESQIHEGFLEEGYRVEFVNSTEELKDRLKNPRNYMVFVDAEGYPDAIKWLRAQGPIEQRRFFWIVLAKIARTAKSALFFQLGASDVLAPPIHPLLARGRAQLMIRRYLNLFDFPEGTLLPHGVMLPVRERPSSEDSPAGSSKVEDQMTWIKGGPFPEGNEIKVIRQDIPFKERYGSDQLKVVESIHSLFRLKSGWFEEVEGEKNQTALVQIASLKQSPITLWSREPRQRLDTSVVHYVPQEHTFILDPVNSELFLKIIGERPIFCHVQLDLASVFFLGKIRPTANSLEVQFPQKMYQVQRRGSLRMDFVGGMNRQVELAFPNRKVLIAEAMDLSSTGLQVQLPTGSLDEISTYSNAWIKFSPMHGIEIETEVQIRWKQVKGKLQAVGLYFVDLPETIRDEIAFRIFEYYGQNFERIFEE